MNFIFFSPHFPKHPAEFCFHLKSFGANVLGIGDIDYSSLSDRLKSALTGYYKVNDLENYDEVRAGVDYFTGRYGQIDRFESLNEHWLEMEARVRADFKIYGILPDLTYDLTNKSRMKEYFRKAGVSVVRLARREDMDGARKFISEVKYPVVVKPDRGVGAIMTRRIKDDRDLEDFFNTKPSGVEFIFEEYVDGTIVSYDGLVDRSGKVRFAASHQFDQSIMDLVNNDDDLFYYSHKKISPDVEDAGKRILRAYDVRERFFHIELFRRRDDGRIIALEVNMRPPGGWVTDTIDYTYDIDIYREWADMVVNDHVGGPYPGKYFVGYAARKHYKSYLYTHDEIIWRYSDKIVNQGPVEPIFSRAMGNYVYQFRSENLDTVREIGRFIQEKRN